MTLCLDLHTHHPVPQPFGIISVDIEEFSPVEGQMYSVGLHPWKVKNVPDRKFWSEFEKIASHPAVVAIGESGIDLVKGPPLFIQMIVLKQQIMISEKLGKPMVIHAVKSHDHIIGMRKDGELTQNWAIHGFRGKPTIAKMYTDAGIYLSYGEKFNPESLIATPRDRILAETDESPLDIEEVIARLSVNLYGQTTEEIKTTTDLIISNTKRFFNKV